MQIKWWAFLLILSITGFKSQAQQNNSNYAVPLGGNSFLTKKAIGGKEEVTNTNWINWQHTDAVFSTYIYFTQPGTLRLAAHGLLTDGKSRIACSIIFAQ